MTFHSLTFTEITFSPESLILVKYNGQSSLKFSILVQIAAVSIADYECRVFILPSVSDCRQCVNSILYHHVHVLDI